MLFIGPYSYGCILELEHLIKNMKSIKMKLIRKNIFEFNYLELLNTLCAYWVLCVYLKCTWWRVLIRTGDGVRIFGM